MHALQSPTRVPYVHTNSDDMVTGLFVSLPARQFFAVNLNVLAKIRDVRLNFVRDPCYKHWSYPIN